MPKRKLKFYISSRVKDREKVKSLEKKLERLGHKTFDWTKYKGLGRPYHNKPRAPSIAQEMTEAIKTVDIFVLFPDLKGGTGMFVELGVALASKKRVFIIAPRITRPIFFFHPSVTHVKSVKGLIEAL